MTSEAHNLFVSFLSRFRVKGQCNFNSAANPKGAFLISDESREEFYKKYAEAVLSNYTTLCMVERCITDHSPIIIDIDFLLDKSVLLCQNINWKYTLDNVKRFILEYKKLLESYICINDINNYIVCIMEKKTYSIKSNDKIGDGIHIMFPYIIAPHSLQLYIRDQIVAEEKIKECFPNVKYENKEAEVFDKAVITNGWTVYGSAGKANGAVYKVSYCYSLSKVSNSFDTFIQREINFNELTNGSFLNSVKILSLHGKEKNTKFRDEEVELHIISWHQRHFKFKDVNAKIFP